MSASQQKKDRAQKRAEGVEKRQLKKKEAAKRAKKEKKTVTIVSVVLVVVTIVLVLFNSTLLYNNFTAVTIGDVRFTASEFSFFYKSSYYNYVNSYGDWLSYLGLDTNKSLSSQAYGEDSTWADYFKDSALSSMESVAMLWTQAQEEGFTLTEEQQADLDESLEGVATAHVNAGYPNANRYYSVNYGKGLTAERVSKLVEMSFIADAYAESKYESFTYNDEEIESHYVENKDDFDIYSYLTYFVSGAADEENGIDAETAMASAKKLADSLISDEPVTVDEPVVEEPEDIEDADLTGTDDETAEDVEDAEAADDDAEVDAESDEESAFRERVFVLAGAEPTAETYQGNNSSLNALYKDWLVDSSRDYADKTVIEAESGYYVLFFISRDGNEYKTVDVRHILFSVEAETDEDGNSVYTDEAKAAALQEAEDVLAEWMAGDKTEDSFAELANTYSTDTGSNEKGGLYEEIYKNQMVPEFNDWIFDPARKTGDTGIVFNEGSYCGYHIIYFVGYDRPYRSVYSEGDLRGADYKDWNTAKLESFTASTGFTAFLVK